MISLICGLGFLFLWFAAAGYGRTSTNLYISSTAGCNVCCLGGTQFLTVSLLRPCLDVRRCSEPSPNHAPDAHTQAPSTSVTPPNYYQASAQATPRRSLISRGARFLLPGYCSSFPSTSLLELLLGAQLVGVAALLLAAVLGAGVQAGVAPGCGGGGWLGAVGADRANKTNRTDGTDGTDGSQWTEM